MTTETKHMPSEREIEAAATKIADMCADGKFAPRDIAIAALATASQSRAPDQEITVRDGKWTQKKVSCRQLAEWISEQATSDRDGLIQRVAEAIEEDRKITRARVPDQSERVRELETALAEARKVIGALTTARSPAEIREADDNARDWHTRNPESSNAK